MRDIAFEHRQHKDGTHAVVFVYDGTPVLLGESKDVREAFMNATENLTTLVVEFAEFSHLAAIAYHSRNSELN